MVVVYFTSRHIAAVLIHSSCARQSSVVMETQYIIKACEDTVKQVKMCGNHMWFHSCFTAAALLSRKGLMNMIIPQNHMLAVHDAAHPDTVSGWISTPVSTLHEPFMVQLCLLKYRSCLRLLFCVNFRISLFIKIDG